MPMNVSSMLKANQTQTPNGTALSASAMLGLPGMGDDLKDQTAEEIKRRKQMGALDNPTQYGSILGAASTIFGGGR